jgi:hypothetical protein
MAMLLAATDAPPHKPHVKPVLKSRWVLDKAVMPVRVKS